MSAISYLKKKIYIFRRKNKLFKCGKNIFIDPSCDISNYEFISMGNNIIIDKDSCILCPLKFYEGIPEKPIIILDDSVCLGRRTFISGIKRVYLHKNVILGQNVFISDHNHNYEDIDKPICEQGINKIESVEIGENTWIGTNASILSGVKIGRNCIIGANSVVTKSFPDYCVVAGNPAKIIKRYNLKKKKWERV